MKYATLEELRKAIQAETDHVWLKEPEEIIRFRNGIYVSKAGSYGYAFPNLVFVNGDLRALASWITPSLIVKMLNDETFTLEQCKKVFAWVNMINIDFLAYCGFVKMGEFAHTIVELYPTIESKEEFFELLKDWYVYVNRMYIWVHHMFPWTIGAAIEVRDEESLVQLKNLASDKDATEKYFAKYAPEILAFKTRK